MLRLNSIAMGLVMVTGMAFAAGCAQMDEELVDEEESVGSDQLAAGGGGGGCPYATTDYNQFHAKYVESFNADTPDHMGCLYEGNATFIDPSSGAVITGRMNIQNQIALYQAGTHMVASTRYAYLGGGNAVLASASFQIIDDATGAIVAAGQSADILRKASNGTWLLVVDHPLGGQ